MYLKPFLKNCVDVSLLTKLTAYVKMLMIESHESENKLRSNVIHVRVCSDIFWYSINNPNHVKENWWIVRQRFSFANFLRIFFSFCRWFVVLNAHSEAKLDQPLKTCKKKYSAWAKERFPKAWQSILWDLITDLPSFKQDLNQTHRSNLSTILTITEPFQRNVRKPHVITEDV